MSAEAAVLGTPFIRYNDFVGKIGYLKELEEKYKLGFGIKADYANELLQRAEEIAQDKKSKTIFHRRREVMLSEKINIADFLYDFIIDLNNSQLQ